MQFIGFEFAFCQAKKYCKNLENSETFDYDEFEATFRVRYMTALEAYLRLHSTKIVALSNQIVPLTVHEEDGQTIVFEEGHETELANKLTRGTKLTEFFNLCSYDDGARKLTYAKIPYQYR